MPRALVIRFGISAALLALLCLGSVVQSADTEGQYAVRGAGLINCALFVEARSARDDAYLVTAGWVDGYITGINQHAPDTYDVLSYESTELLMALLDQHCQEHPNDPVFGVLNRLFAELREGRLTAKSEKVPVAVGEREGRHYVALIERVQQKLRDGGFFEGPVNGDFSPQTVEAIKRFQESVDFTATGFPDQKTLWRLLRSE